MFAWYEWIVDIRPVIAGGTVKRAQAPNILTLENASKLYHWVGVAIVIINKLACESVAQCIGA